MDREIKLRDVATVLEELEYPIDRSDASAAVEHVTLTLADGQVNLGETIEKSTSETFRSAGDLESELHNTLPREAVGEPYQSEGDA
ncbi:DUF5789 family protein [Halobellus sp. GM3]|uniref:DUF5789 family protein n=1 Tax=Halobellus sp. GM3 TaxID=3458410 RepID=UPI00403DF020